MFSFVVFTLLIAVSYVNGADNGWIYDDTSSWPSKYPGCSTKAHPRQSPINFETMKNIYRDDLGPLELQSASEDPRLFKWINSGLTVKSNFNYTKNTYTMTGNGHLNRNVFILYNIHLHWGDYNKMGSEHTVDFKHYPAELHLVHIEKELLYSGATVQEIIHATDKIAVIGAFIEVGEEDNEYLADFFNQLPSLRFNDSKPIEVKMQPYKMLKNVTHYYRYEGGLTTPQCQGSVIWSVLHETIKVSERQLYQLYTLYSSSTQETIISRRLVNNFRPIQKTGYRNVYQTWRPLVGEASSLSRISASVMILFVMASILTQSY